MLIEYDIFTIQTFSCKMNTSLPNINVFKNIVKSHKNIEKYQAKTLVQFERKWHQFASAWGKRASLYNIVI